MKRDLWTEVALHRLPVEETDKFERKGGELFNKEDQLLNSVAKALSAFANSGGGSLVLGVKDNGIPDGLPSSFRNTPTRDWLEQKIPYLLDFPLSDFRVQTVIKYNTSTIPDNRDVIVIDVGDSAAAPHQSKRDFTYYYRVGGRSLPAPHFYLELLRQRLTSPNLIFELVEIVISDVKQNDEGLFVEAKLNFRITNIGRIASYEWFLRVIEYENPRKDVFPERERDYRFSTRDYPYNKPQAITFSTGTRTILPGCSFLEGSDLGFQLRPKERTTEAIHEDLDALLSDLVISYRLATETSQGESVAIRVASALEFDKIESAVRQKCRGFYNN